MQRTDVHKMWNMCGIRLPYIFHIWKMHGNLIPHMYYCFKNSTCAHMRFPHMGNNVVFCHDFKWTKELTCVETNLKEFVNLHG